MCPEVTYRHGNKFLSGSIEHSNSIRYSQCNEIILINSLGRVIEAKVVEITLYYPLGIRIYSTIIKQNQIY